MGDLVAFLQGIQLEHLSAIFQREEINFEILLQMKDSDLKEVGITKFGNRKTILNAIQNLRDSKEVKGNVENLVDDDNDHYDKVENEPYLSCYTSSNTFSDYQEMHLTGEKILKYETIGFERGQIAESVIKDQITDSSSLLQRKTRQEYLLYSRTRDEVNPYQNIAGPCVVERQSSVTSRTDQQVGAQSMEQSNSTNTNLHEKADQVCDAFIGKSDMYASVQQHGTAFEQVAALFEDISRKKKKAKEVFREIYLKLQQLWECNDLFVELREELVKEYGDFETFIKERVEDLSDDSCPIVVTGETSAGKSTFVNLLLGVDILPQSSLSCTAAICRIHNEGEKKVVLSYKSGKQTDLDIKPDIEAAEMKTHLKQHVSITASQQATLEAMGGDVLQYVDIWWPIEKIPQDILIVDTPGVGPDDPNLTDKLFEYLPNALAFIYVLNTPNAGGVQKDRV